MTTDDDLSAQIESMQWIESHRARRVLVVADVVESVRLMQAHEADVIDRWRRYVSEVVEQVLPARSGRLVKSLGDGMLLEFEAVVPAVLAALDMQARMVAYNQHRGPEAAMHLRMGVHTADVVVDQLDVYGAGVNLAARVASLGAAGDIVVTADVRDQLVDQLDAVIEDMGSCWLKHIDTPVRAYRVRPVAEAGVRAETRKAAEDTDVAMTIAVIPLSCVAGDERQALLGDFIADSLIASLSLSRELRVLSRLSTRAVGVRALDTQSVGQLLGAAYVLSGSFAVHGKQVVIDLEIAETRNSTVIDVCRLSCQVAALFAHPSEPIHKLIEVAYRAILNTEAQRTQSLPLPTLESYTLLLGSIGLIHRTETKDFEQTQAVLSALIDRVPRHALGYVWLAKWHLLRMIRGISPTPEREPQEARRRIDLALERDAASGVAWALKGLVHAYDGQQLEQAEEALQRALLVNASEPLAWLYMASLRSWQGNGAEAVVSAKEALALSPFDPMRYYFESLAAAAKLAAGELDESMKLCRNSLRVHRNHTPTYRVLTIAQVMAGDLEGARQTMKRMREMEPTLTVRAYLERYPGRRTPHAQVYAAALEQAGMPS